MATNGSLVSIAQRNVVQVTAIPITIATSSILIKKIEEE
jgi:hypothetical protein